MRLVSTAASVSCHLQIEHEGPVARIKAHMRIFQSACPPPAASNTDFATTPHCSTLKTVQSEGPRHPFFSDGMMRVGQMSSAQAGDHRGSADQGLLVPLDRG